MANTSPVYARIDTNLKENAESILSKLGVTPSSLIQMLYSQVVLKNGVPFDLTLEVEKPINLAELSKKEIDLELQKAVDSLESGVYYTSDEVKKFFENYGK